MEIEDAVELVRKNYSKTTEECQVLSAELRQEYWIVTTMCEDQQFHIYLIDNESNKIISVTPPIS